MSSKLYYTSAAPLDASKKTVVFLHAAFMSSTMWVDQIAYLAPKFPDTNFLLIDVNGHGKTTEGRKHFTLYDQCDDIAALMDQLSIRSAVFVGLSAGSLISMRMALAHPTRVNGVVALSSISRPSSQAVLDAFGQVFQIWTSTPVPSEEIMNLSIGAWGGDLDVDSDRCKIIKRDWKTRYNGAKNVEAIADCVNARDDVTGKLKGIKCPVLLVQGEKDVTWTVEEAEITKQGLPNAELKVISGGGHMLIFARKADDVNGLIEGFLKKQGY